MNDDIMQVTLDAFRSDVSVFADMAIQRPVVITQNGRASTVMISYAEYDRLKSRDRLSFDPRDLSAEEAGRLLEVLKKATPSANATAFNHET